MTTWPAWGCRSPRGWWPGGGRGGAPTRPFSITPPKQTRSRFARCACVVPRRAPKTLTVEQIVAVLAACEHLRDRFLFALMAETGLRVGSSLGTAPR